MSAPAAAAPRLAAAMPARVRGTAAADSVGLRLVAFLLLCALGAVEWAAFLASPPTGRALGVAAIATAGGAALAVAAHGGATPRARVRLLRAVACVAVVAAAAVGACVTAGLPARLLLPAHWHQLADGLDRGLTGASSTGWPYFGGDRWVRLTVMLGVPALAVPAMALAFWPARRAGARRGAALVLLLVLFAVPATEREAGRPHLLGLLLLALLATWLWLPRLAARRLGPAALALLAAAPVSLPVAAALDGHVPWVDYTRWDPFASRGGGHSFDWTHRYGPLDWPRDGTTMLDVKSPHQHYWKAETLDRFDGLRWSHSDAGHSSDPTAEIPLQRDPRWDERIRITVRGLRSDLLVAAGTVFSVDGSKLVVGSADGTIRVLDGPMSKGDAYTVMTYVPDPSAAKMRAAPARFATQFLSYTYFDLPRRGDSATASAAPADGGPSVTSRTIGAPRPGLPPDADVAVRDRILASPYARTYRLARQLAAGQPTTYDVVRRVERHLQDGYAYDEHPPLRRLPLDAFLFRDRLGYCQQFSGAMALLLRMNGIPARVAAGFAPGTLDPATKEYRVRDFDAHSWVEVWFEGIGWVPFDPTPTVAPASAQATGDALPSAALGGHDSGKDAGGQKRLRPADLGGRGGAGDGSSVWAVVATVVGLPLAGVALLWAVAVARARRVRGAGGDPDVRELRFALERLGHPLAAGATLLDVERRLRVTAGSGAARYVAALRERRFASAARAAAVRLDRRALRRGLAEGRGPIVRLRALLVLPPRRHGSAPGGSS